MVRVVPAGRVFLGRLIGLGLYLHSGLWAFWCKAVSELGVLVGKASFRASSVFEQVLP